MTNGNQTPEDIKIVQRSLYREAEEGLKQIEQQQQQREARLKALQTPPATYTRQPPRPAARSPPMPLPYPFKTGDSIKPIGGPLPRQMSGLTPQQMSATLQQHAMRARQVRPSVMKK